MSCCEFCFMSKICKPKFDSDRLYRENGDESWEAVGSAVSFIILGSCFETGTVALCTILHVCVCVEGGRGMRACVWKCVSMFSIEGGGGVICCVACVFAHDLVNSAFIGYSATAYSCTQTTRVFISVVSTLSVSATSAFTTD